MMTDFIMNTSLWMLQNLQLVLYETELFKPLLWFISVESTAANATVVIIHCVLLIRAQWQDKEVGYLCSPPEVLPSSFTLLGI